MSKHWPYFAAAFALLGFLAVCAVAGLVLVLVDHQGKASKASVQAIQERLDPGAEQAYKDACTAQIQGAAASGVTLVECKLAAPKEVGLKHNPDVKGDIANVYLMVKSTEGQVYLVYVALDKSAWTMTNYKVTPLAAALKTIEKPA